MTKQRKAELERLYQILFDGAGPSTVAFAMNGDGKWYRFVVQKASGGEWQQLSLLSEVQPTTTLSWKHTRINRGEYNKPAEAWCVKNFESVILPDSTRINQPASKAVLTNMYSVPWEELERAGYSCVKVEINEEE